jgi:Zn-dependent membrane protease YugP
MDYSFLALVVPALVFSIITQISVNGAYRKFSRIPNSRQMTGAQAAQRVLQHAGVMNVRIEPVGGRLSDHYDPRANVIRLSEDIYAGMSVAAVGIACHEAGHAVQYAQRYLPIRVRNVILPLCRIGSFAGVPLAILGYFLSFGPLITVGLGLYAAVAVFQLATLPVEFNASRRALQIIDEHGLLLGAGEYDGAKKVLRAAALTYVASLAVTLMSLLRMLLLFQRRGRR